MTVDATVVHAGSVRPPGSGLAASEHSGILVPLTIYSRPASAANSRQADSTSAISCVGAVRQDAGSGRLPGCRTSINFSLMEPDVTIDDGVVNLGEATPRRLLVEWANSQDAWVRKLTAETILSRQAPTADLVDSVYAVFLSEKGLSDEELASVPKLEVEEVEAAKDENLELASLGNIQSVNALASDQELEFDQSLTILFGQNGSGKTGYARIIKRLSAVRSPEDILPNAHAVHLDPPPPPSADIKYRVGAEERTARWT